MNGAIEPRAHVPISLVGGAAAVAISFGAIFGLMADLQKKMGFADAGLGVVAAAAFVAGFVAQIWLARYADRGHGRLMLISGVSFATIGCLGVAVASNLVLLIVARLVLGFGEGLFLPAARRVVIIRNPHAVGAALGRLGAAQTGGFLLGPPFGAFVAASFGLRTPFVVLALVLVGVTAAVARFEVPPTVAEAPPQALRTLIGNLGVRVGIYIGVGMTVAIGVYDSLWSRFLKDLGASTKFVALSLTIFGLPIVILGPLAGRLADRFGPARMGVIGLLGGAPFVFGYGWLTNVWVIAVLAFVHSTFDAAVVPASQAQVARAAPHDLVAAGQGLLDATGLLVAALSSLVAAPLYQRFSGAVVWSALSVCVASSALLAARANARVHQLQHAQHVG